MSTDLKKRNAKMSTTQAPALDMNKLNAFIGQFVTDLGASVHAGMVVIGEKLGLYKALAARPMGSAELAAKTQTDERYLREWLASQAAGGYVTYDEKSGELPAPGLRVLCSDALPDAARHVRRPICSRFAVVLESGLPERAE
jgi:hypothetical protein